MAFLSPRSGLQDGEGSGGKVCGVLSCVFGGVSFIPFCFLPLFSLAGMTLGIVSLSISKNKALGVVGTVLSVLGVAAGVFWLLLLIQLSNR